MVIDSCLKDYKVTSRHSVGSLLFSVVVAQRTIDVGQRLIDEECAQPLQPADGGFRVRVFRYNVFGVKRQNVSDGDFVCLARPRPRGSRVLAANVSS
jgi:hypothetical protein